MNKLIRSLCALAICGAMPLLRASPAEAEALDDRDIANAILSEIRTDLAFSTANEIRAKSDAGIVTLSGIAQNLLAKERAATLAETVRGVRSVVNLITVEPVRELSSHELERNVQFALAADPAADSYEIEVSADENGKVVLTGAVDSWQEKQVSVLVAKGVRGVTDIDNLILNTNADTRTEHEIASDVKSRLKWDALVDPAFIEVTVDGKRVSLEGLVGSAAEKARASEDAWVTGVDSVDNSGLEVVRLVRDRKVRFESEASADPAEIIDAVREGLRTHPYVKSHKISVDISDDRRIELTGTVYNLRAKEAAESVARRTFGVADVDNRIHLQVPEPVPDSVVEANVRNLFELDPWIDASRIRPESKHGVVSLTGAVDRAFERYHAETVAYGAHGLREVVNRIEVEEEPDAPEKKSELVYDPYLWHRFPYPWVYHSALPPIEYNPKPAVKTATDDQIERQIGQELFWSPFVDREDVLISVINGTALLTGSVDSQRERQAATENAFEGGAAVVINQLRIKS